MVIFCGNIILPRPIIQYLAAAVTPKKVQGQHIMLLEHIIILLSRNDDTSGALIIFVCAYLHCALRNLKYLRDEIHSILLWTETFTTFATSTSLRRQIKK